MVTDRYRIAADNRKRYVCTCYHLIIINQFFSNIADDMSVFSSGSIVDSTSINITDCNALLGLGFKAQLPSQPLNATDLTSLMMDIDTTCPFNYDLHHQFQWSTTTPAQTDNQQ